MPLLCSAPKIILCLQSKLAMLCCYIRKSSGSIKLQLNKPQRVSGLFLNSRILYLERLGGVFWGAYYNDLYGEALLKGVSLSG